MTTQASSTDRRATQVCMTPQGEHALTRVRAEGSRVFGAAFGPAHAAEIDGLVSQLRRLFARLDDMELPATRSRTGVPA